MKKDDSLKSFIKSTVKELMNENKECIKSEKETLFALRNLLGKEAVWLVGKNAYGDRTKYEFGFPINEIEKRYNAEDKNVDITSMLEDELRKNGFKVINIFVGSLVHGWISRVVKLPC